MIEHQELLQGLLEEQRKTNQLLVILIETLVDEDDGEEPEPQTYIDGTPVA